MFGTNCASAYASSFLNRTPCTSFECTIKVSTRVKRFSSIHLGHLYFVIISACCSLSCFLRFFFHAKVREQISHFKKRTNWLGQNFRVPRVVRPSVRQIFVHLPALIIYKRRVLTIYSETNYLQFHHHQILIFLIHRMVHRSFVFDTVWCNLRLDVSLAFSSWWKDFFVALAWYISMWDHCLLKFV